MPTVVAGGALSGALLCVTACLATAATAAAPPCDYVRALPRGTAAAWLRLEHYARMAVQRGTGNDHVHGLWNQDSPLARHTYAAALVACATADAVHVRYVRDAVAALAASGEDGGAAREHGAARVLALARNLGAYVAAAQLLVDVLPRDIMLRFKRWLLRVRVVDVGGHGRWNNLTRTAEDSATNWGALAQASRLAVATFLGDTAEVRRVAVQLRRFCGDRSVPHAFKPAASHDVTWQCDAATPHLPRRVPLFAGSSNSRWWRWDPINSPVCGSGRDGALVEDAARGGACCRWPPCSPTRPCALRPPGTGYALDTMHAVVVQALLLQRYDRRTYGDVWQW